MLARRIAWGIMRLCVQKRSVSVTTGGPSAVSVTTGGAERSFPTAISFAPGVNRKQESTDHVIDDATSFVHGGKPGIKDDTEWALHRAARAAEFQSRFWMPRVRQTSAS